MSAPSDEQQIAEESETSPVDKSESIPAVAEMSDESEQRKMSYLE